MKRVSKIWIVFMWILLTLFIVTYCGTFLIYTVRLLKDNIIFKSAWLMHTHLCSYVWTNCRHQFNSCHDSSLTWHPLLLVVTQEDLALTTFAQGYEVIQTWQGRPKPSYHNLNNLIKPPHNHSAYLVAQSHYMTCSQFLSGHSPLNHLPGISPRPHEMLS